jgi:hypothetical protein
MNHKTFVLTISCAGEGSPINFTVINPVGSYKSGQRSYHSALNDVLDELKNLVDYWNSNNPDNKFY